MINKALNNILFSLYIGDKYTI